MSDDLTKVPRERAGMQAHGQTGYRRWGCRCEVCCAAYEAFREAERIRRVEGRRTPRKNTTRATELQRPAGWGDKPWAALQVLDATIEAPSLEDVRALIEEVGI